eukprot:scaffold38424_cov168-Amphora_coffeaeformis.AAC.1
MTSRRGVSPPLRFRLLLSLLAVVLFISIQQLFLLDTTSSKFTDEWGVVIQEVLSTTENVPNESSVNNTITTLGIPDNNPTEPSLSNKEKTTCIESAAYPLEYTNYSKKNRTISSFMVQEASDKFVKVQPVSAICRFLHTVPFSKHFPHAAQQLYRCWSWWRHQQQVYANFNVTPMLQMDPTSVPVPQNPFLKGFMQLLEGSLALQVISDPINVSVVDNAISGHAKLKKGFLYDYAMASTEDARALREAAVRVFDLPPVPTGCDAAKNPRISILNRQSKRNILNWEQLKDALDSIGRVSVDYFEGKTFRDQIDFMINTDILVSPHGAQLASLPFAPPCASVLEIFPTGYYEPAFFGTLAASSGVSHSFVYLGTNRTVEVTTGSASVWARRKTRKASICPPVQPLKVAVTQAVVAWNRCCERQNPS